MNDQKMVMQVHGSIAAFKKCCDAFGIKAKHVASMMYEVKTSDLGELMKHEGEFTLAFNAQNAKDSIKDASTLLLQPDEYDIIVSLKDVSAEDAKTMKDGINGFSDDQLKEYAEWHGSTGFIINKKHFDHAEYKGETISYSKYLEIHGFASDETDEQVSDVKALDDGSYSVKAESAEDAVTKVKAYILSKSKSGK